jgi:hypothetical protein
MPTLGTYTPEKKIETRPVKEILKEILSGKYSYLLSLIIVFIEDDSIATLEEEKEIRQINWYEYPDSVSFESKVLYLNSFHH